MKEHITRKLRKNQTPWEKKLWSVLKNRGIGGLKFRRQFKIGNAVVDFRCPERKLVVELDGGQHNIEENIRLDKKREREIEQRGYKMLRFWNHEVDNNLEGIIDIILQYALPHPSPLPHGRG